MPAAQFVTVTDKAAAKAKSLLKDGQALRISIISGGCSGMEYKLQPDANPPKPADKVVETKGIKIYLDAAGLMYMVGSELDYESSLIGSKFKFKNPNAVAECSCGESFTT